MRAGFLGCLLLLLTSEIKAAESAPLHPLPGDEQDLVLFLDSRPYLIRLHLQINGRSFRRNWDETVGHLFRFLDADGDGFLSPKEVALAPSRTQWVSLMTGTIVEPDGAPEFAELAGDPKATKVTREQFGRYYSNSGAGALLVEWGWRPPSQDKLSDALFAKLDTNKDGVLSRAELSAAHSVLHSLDVNGDDLIQADELSANSAYPAFTYRAASDGQTAPKPFPFVIVPAEGPATVLASEMLNRFDGNKDHKLSRTEWPLDKKLFEQLDSNGNGELDTAELVKWRKLPPELELIVPLEPNSRKDILILPTVEGKPDRLVALKPPGRDGLLRVPVAEKQLEVVRNDRGAAVRQELLKQFDAMAGKSNVLTEKKIYQPPFTFVAMLRLADRNGDNQLTRKELTNYLDVQEKFLFRTSYLSVVDRGPSLFEFVDADHDGRLSPRELRSAWTRLAPWDKDGAGRIARQQVPRQFQLVMSFGSSRSNTFGADRGFADMPLFRDRSRGPLWFRKMDRNGDGDVSPLEFLGTPEQFRKIDTDGDGLIDVTEAERADKDTRKRK